MLDIHTLLNELEILCNSFTKKFDNNVKDILKHDKTSRLTMVYLQV